MNIRKETIIALHNEERLFLYFSSYIITVSRFDEIGTTKGKYSLILFLFPFLHHFSRRGKKRHIAVVPNPQDREICETSNAEEGKEESNKATEKRKLGKHKNTLAVSYGDFGLAWAQLFPQFELWPRAAYNGPVSLSLFHSLPWALSLHSWLLRETFLDSVLLSTRKRDKSGGGTE